MTLLSSEGDDLLIQLHGSGCQIFNGSAALERGTRGKGALWYHSKEEKRKAWTWHVVYCHWMAPFLIVHFKWDAEIIVLQDALRTVEVLDAR